MLILYDPKVYKVSDKDHSVIELTKRVDIINLNLLTSSHARDVILFSDWNQLSKIQESARVAERYRAERDAVLEEFISESDPFRSLIHLSFPSPNLRLTLSFMKLRRRMQRVPLAIRAREFRDRPLAKSEGQPVTVFRRKDT